MNTLEDKIRKTNSDLKIMLIKNNLDQKLNAKYIVIDKEKIKNV